MFSTVHPSRHTVSCNGATLSQQARVQLPMPYAISKTSYKALILYASSDTYLCFPPSELHISCSHHLPWDLLQSTLNLGNVNAITLAGSNHQIREAEAQPRIINLHSLQAHAAPLPEVLVARRH